MVPPPCPEARSPRHAPLYYDCVSFMYIFESLAHRLASFDLLLTFLLRRTLPLVPSPVIRLAPTESSLVVYDCQTPSHLTIIEARDPLCSG